MRVTLVLAVALLFQNVLLAQKNHGILTIDEKSGMVEIVEVVNIPGVEPAELYKRLETWAKSFYPNPTAVLTEKDPEKGKLGGQHQLNIFHTVDGVRNRAGLVKYRVEMAARDGRVRLHLHDMFLQQSPKLYVSSWITEEKYKGERTTDFLNQLDEFFTKLVSSFKESVSKAPEGPATDDW